MSLLAVLAATSTGTPVDPDPPADPYLIVGDTTPYAMPTSAPYNPPTYMVTPTPDGTGSVVHPGVHDFGATKWNGKRFWMAITPYKDSDDQKENPCILQSHDGFTWTVPAGLTNPLDPAPGSPDLNSDTELYYDAPSGRLYCFWRTVTDGLTTETIYRSYSTDGVTWSAKQVAVTVTSDGVQLLSPAIRKLGSTFFLWTNNRRLSASAIDGTFGSGTATTWNGQGGATIPGSNWHIGVEVVGTEVWALLNKHTPYKTFAARSTDGGLTFTVNPTPVIEPTASGWDNGDINGTYRATFQLHENGTKARVWYSAMSANSTTSWRAGYTIVPRTYWTSIT